MAQTYIVNCVDRPGTNGSILSLTHRLGIQCATAIHFDQMPRPNKQIVRTVLLGLMLIVGTVQAHVSYYCGMMDAVIHVDCCCADSEVDDGLLADNEPCCEKSVELVIDNATDQAQVTAKPIKFESDADPPDAVASTIQPSVQAPGTALISGVNHTWISHTAKTATYLLTQRLRI